MYVSKFDVDGKKGIKVKDAEARANIESLTAEVNENSSDIDNLQGQVTNIAGNTNNLGVRMTRAESDIDALEIDVNSVKNRLSNAESDIDDANESLTDLEERVRNNTFGIMRNNVDMESLAERVTELSTLEEGSTTGDAELLGIRIGYNGVTYDSAGDAVRKQVQSLADGLLNVYTYERPAPADGYSLFNGYVSPVNGGNIDGNNNLRTTALDFAFPAAIYMTDDVYKYSVYGFSHTPDPLFLRPVIEDVNGSAFTVIPNDIGSVKLVFELASDPTHVMTDDDRDAIRSALKIMYNPDSKNVNAGYSQNFTDGEKALGRDNIGAASASVVNDRTTYNIDPSELGFSYGGLFATGSSSVSTTRLRLLGADGKGGINVLAGSTITSNPGYKFNVALYKSYVSNENFELLAYQTMMQGTFTVPVDCFIRVAFGTEDDDDLWTTVDSIKTLTPAGVEAVSGALVLNLIGGTVKNKIEVLESRESSGDTGVTVIPLEDDIPLNALAYHALWDELVSKYGVKREELGFANNNDSNFPIYGYIIRSDMNHLNENYSINVWSDANPSLLYERPKALLTGGVHGNERTAPMAILDFVTKLFTDVTYQPMRTGYDWYIIPLINPWGFSHTAMLNGVEQNGSGTPLSDYTIIDNTATNHRGIRYNSNGVDINRDFGSTSVTVEANCVKSFVQAHATANDKFEFAIDGHQASTSNLNPIGAFLSLDANATQEDLNFIYRYWMETGAETERLMANYVDAELVQSVFPWDGTSASTIRNWNKAFAKYSMCLEGGQNCAYYSGTAVWSNPICRMFINTQYHHFIQRLTAVL